MKKMITDSITKTGVMVDMSQPEIDIRLAEEIASIDPELEAARQDMQAEQALNRAVDATFLDGFWILFKAFAPIGVTAIDNAVAANNKNAFIQFFKDGVKAKL